VASTFDPAAKVSVRSLIASLRREGRSILLTTHELADVERLADSVAILHHGQIVAHGTVAELTGGTEPAARIRLAAPLEEADRGRLAAALSSPDQRVTVDPDREPASYRLAGVPMTPVLLRHLAEWCSLNGIGIEEWRVGHGSLEERYLELTGDVTALGEGHDERASRAEVPAPVDGSPA
jgi:ABC-2 type transport system ATP-binding protein